MLLIAGLGPAQLGPVEEGRRLAAMGRLVGDGADLECEEQGPVRYCAMPGYAPWIDQWAAAVEPVLAGVRQVGVCELRHRRAHVASARGRNNPRARGKCRMWPA